MTGTKSKSHRNKKRARRDPYGIKGMENMMVGTTEAVGRAAVGIATVGLAGAVIGRI